MAKIYSATFHAASTTPGERGFVTALATLFKERDDVLIWHGAQVEGKFTDVILFEGKTGLVVFEVKDWSLRSIESLSVSGAVIRKDGRLETRTQPHEQARAYTFSCRNAIELHAALRNDDGKFKNRGLIPVDKAVVFTNIERAQAESGSFSSYFRQFSGETLYGSELREGGRFGGPKGGAELLSFLRFLRSFGSRELTEAQRKVLHEKVLGGLPPFDPLAPPPSTKTEGARGMGPSVKTTPTVRGGGASAPGLRASPSGEGRRPMKVELSKRALKWASELDVEPRLIRGVAGCGKTLFLVKHAELKAAYAVPPRRILYTCYNLPLTGYVRGLLDENLAPGKRERVDVLSIYELVGRIAGQDVPHQGPTEKIRSLEQAAFEALGRNGLPFAAYDTVLIDEAQDFSPDLLRLALATLAPGSEDVKIAEDSVQDLYSKRPRGFSWASLGINVTGGRARNHLQSYRCTQPIFEFARDLLGEQADDDDDVDGLFNSDLGGRDGERPTHRQMPSAQALMRLISDDVEQQVKQGRRLGEMAVLYVSRLLLGDPAPLPSKPGKVSFEQLASRNLAASSEVFIDALKEQVKHPVEWFTRDVSARLNLDMGSPTIKVGSVYSAKGLDFECVYLVDLTGEAISLGAIDGGESKRTKHHRRLLYVGATRAKDRLAYLQLMP